LKVIFYRAPAVLLAPINLETGGHLEVSKNNLHHLSACLSGSLNGLLE
jgi:hypothetical protein